MSGYTKAELKRLCKEGGYHINLLANEVLTYREINKEIQKDGRRAAEIIQSLEARIKELESEKKTAYNAGLERAIEKITFYLRGIDETEINNGWWETSTGAEWGKDIFDSLIKAIQKEVEPPSTEGK